MVWLYNKYIFSYYIWFHWSNIYNYFYIIKGNQNTQVKQANLNFILLFNVIFILQHFIDIILIFIICLLVIVILDIIQIKKDSENNFGKSFIFLTNKIIDFILYSFEDVTPKVIFLKYYFASYFLLLMNAIIIFDYWVIFSNPFNFIKN